MRGYEQEHNQQSIDGLPALVMITGVHAIMFARGRRSRSARSCATSSTWTSVDAGGGWPIFALPPAEIAAHPATTSGRYELYLMCDDIEATMARAEGQGRRVHARRSATRAGAS